MCGGCQKQHLPYEEQILAKEFFLSRLFHKDIQVIPSPAPFFYRNRMDFVCMNDRIGLRQRGMYNTIIPIEECLLLSEETNDTITFIKKLTQKHSIPFYNLDTHNGFLRYIVFREAKFTGERMINFVTNGTDYLPFQDFLKEFAQYFPLTSINWLTNNTPSDTSTGILHQTIGKPHITERFDTIQYSIKPNTFFQTNPAAAFLLFKDIKNNILPNARVLDLYCGIGAISLFIAHKTTHVLGMECVEESVQAARENAQHNNITNATFTCQDLTKPFTLQQTFNTVIVDPPRAGLSESAISTILTLKPAQVISVSCNPLTHKRDLDRLSTAYTIKTIKGYDFTPHTEHVEMIAVLERKNQ